MDEQMALPVFEEVIPNINPMTRRQMFGVGLAVDGKSPVYLIDENHHLLHPEPVCWLNLRYHAWFEDTLRQLGPSWLVG